MVDSTLGAIAFLFLAAVALAFVNPIIAIVPLLLLFAFLGVKAAGGLFKHAAPTADQTGTSPSVPSTAEASYDPVTDPSDRGA